MGTWRGYDLVFFDCDSTLTRIEGIDELARLKGLLSEVQRLTAAAMDGEVHLNAIYDARLDLLRPTRAEIRVIERLYRANLTPDACDLTEALHHLGRQVFIVSGGLSPAVQALGESIGVPRDHIRAVDVVFDRLAGRWWEYPLDRARINPAERYLEHDAGLLTETHGKCSVVRTLREERPGRALLVGDGVSDLLARPAVDLMVGFGGVVRRERVAAEAGVFVESESLAPILPLAASPADFGGSVPPVYARLLAKGLGLIREGAVHFKDETIREKILGSYRGWSYCGR